MPLLPALRSAARKPETLVGQLPRQRMAMLCALLPLLPAVALAQSHDTYPTKPITLVVPMSPGGAADVVSRLVSQRLSQQLGQPVIVLNQAGAAGSIGASTVARAAGDGYTLFMGVSSVMVVNPAIEKSAAFDAARDFRPIIFIARAETVFVANPTRGFKTLGDVIQYAKKNPGKLAYGSNGIGSASHIGVEYLQMLADVEMLHVPYKGQAPAEAAVISDEIGMMITATVSALPHIRSGRLVPLAMASSGSSSTLPNVPSASATVAGYAVDTWLALYAPAATDEAVVTRLNGASAQILRDPEVIQQFRGLGLEPLPGTPEELRAFQAREAAVWARVVAAARLKGKLDGK